MDLESQLAQLAEPIAAGDPCGRSLDDSQTLAALEAYRVFGRLKAAADEPNWQALRTECLHALGESKDLRVLAYLAAAVLRIDPPTATLQIFPLMATWLELYWDELHPRVSDDVVARRNALMFFADRLGVLDALRRTPVVYDARLGSLSVRDFEIATGVLRPSDPDTAPISREEIDSALAAADPQALRRISDLAHAAAEGLRRIETLMLERGGGYEAVPQLDSLFQVLQRMQEMLAPHTVAAPQGTEVIADSTAVPNTSFGEQSWQAGKITSREDVQRALDAVVSYYRACEPGSLVPIIIERAKRLVSLNFLDALAEVAPEAAEVVKAAVGVREQSS